MKVNTRLGSDVAQKPEQLKLENWTTATGLAKKVASMPGVNKPEKLLSVDAKQAPVLGQYNIFINTLIMHNRKLTKF